MEKEPQLNNYDEYEIDLKEYIMLLWKNKFFIGGLVILAMIIAFAYSTFMVEPVYQAKSTLLILPPRYTTSLEVESFSIDTYRNLATTDSIKQKVIDDLDLRNENGERYSADQLDNMMNIEILASEESDNGDAPLIELRVKSKDPEMAAEIANAWAENFMDDSKEIRQNEVLEEATVIQEQFEDTEEKLNNLKSDLLEFNKENRLELLSQRLDNKKDKLNEHDKKILDLEKQLGSKNAEFKNINSQLDKMEQDGDWIGELNNRDYDNDNYNLLKIKDRFVNYQNKLKTFNQDNDLTLLQGEIESVRNNINEYQNKISELENSLVDLKEENEELTRVLDEENKRWIVNRSVDNNTLWSSILTEGEINLLDQLKLEDEMINPIYKKAKDNLTDNNIDSNKIPTLIEYYNNEVQNEKDRLEKLNENYYELKFEKENINLNLSNYKDSYDNYVQEYQDLVNKKVDLELETEEIETELNFYQEKEEELIKEIEELQDKLWEGENEKSLLKQKIDDVQNTYDSLASRVEEARITEAQRTSDVKFYAEAITPSKPLANNKLLNVAIAAVLALMLGIFIVFFREFMKEE
ncbi:MAG: GumC family protein [Halanaerobium sp.]